MKDTPTKTVTGYCEPLSLRAGEPATLMASSHLPGLAALDLVRIICGDPTRTGPGFNEIEIPSELPKSVELAEQALTPGSFGVVDLEGINVSRQIVIDLHVYPTRVEETQTVFELSGSNAFRIALLLKEQHFVCVVGKTELSVSAANVIAGRWYHLQISVDVASGGVSRHITCLPTRSPGRDLAAVGETRTKNGESAAVGSSRLGGLLFGASQAGQRYDGRIARPRITIDDVELVWDFSQDMAGRKIVDVSGNGRHGVLHQLPARAVTGPDWDGSEHVWKNKPEHYDAIHFHSDDMYDAGWPATAKINLPDDLPSGIYAFRLRQGEETDRIPFFVRPAAGAPTADIALLMSSCTYMAYANHRMLFEGADFVAARSKLRPEHEYIRQHRNLGPSMYEKHDDGSGVMYSSRRRPVLQLRPGADGWNFTPDTDINAFLAHLNVGHDVIADEDVHHDGYDALAPYRVIVTGTHPEYWSTAMIEALDKWQRNGGRLVYLGGNGFYWRVAFSDEWPGAIELRRAEDGVRNWQTEPGESYHSFTGEYGGLWRRLGRAPNELVGVGFAAQGFERAAGYRRNKASYDSRAAWIFDGVEDEMIGTSGLGGGAAGQELDSYNQALGSPAHALVLASATDFGPDMTRTKEELDASIVVPSPDPVVRSDIVFFETPAGGAVFSVGSISWFGALARNDFDNDVSRVTENVIRRFLNPEEFSLS
ncbi:MAG: N,N-dimethylformamidase beta subunit family domain-containing protein [Gammaproteobacteria bacterium]